jgi:hypothetical protein
VACRHAVGSDHEVRDEILGPVLLFGFKALEFIVDKCRARLDRFEIERTVRVPDGLQSLSHAVLESEVLVETANDADPLRQRAATLQPAGHAVVSEPGTVAYRCSVDVRTLRRSIRNEDHLDDDGKAV